MSKLIAIGGGDNGGDFDKKLENTIRGFIEKESPRVIFIPYASLDFEDNFKDFREIYEDLGCVVDLLQPGKENMLLESDLIYIGRGWTIPLVERLIETNSKPFLLQAMENGAIVVGFSGGAHALFSHAGSKEEGKGYTIVEGLGFVQGCIISHYNYQDRAEAFHQLLSNHSMSGIGLEDHAMMVIEENIARVFSSKADSKGFMIKTKNSNLIIQPIDNNDTFLLV